MLLRAPAYPLITMDPFVSIWAPNEILNYKAPIHWTGSPMNLYGLLSIDDTEYSFLGYDRTFKKMKQVSVSLEAMSTKYVFETKSIQLSVTFTSPLFLDNLDLCSRPISYIALKYKVKDKEKHKVVATIMADKSLCTDRPKDQHIQIDKWQKDNLVGASMHNISMLPFQNPGDHRRIDWGYFYLAVKNGFSNVRNLRGNDFMAVSSTLVEEKESVFLVAYDDMEKSINYFGKTCKSYWNNDGKSIDTAIYEANDTYEEIQKHCDEFSDNLYKDAVNVGGNEYAELCLLGYRQTIAAHKLIVCDGQTLFVSKECDSGGLAGTVDVSYPSMPLFLLYNPELVRAMLRPIYVFAKSVEWPFPYAPHDVGYYPVLTGQAYGKNAEGLFRPEKQMPLEECGNMILMELAYFKATGNKDSLLENQELLTKWANYLDENFEGKDVQLCTDDFAGPMAGNVNLSIKAVVSLEAMSQICDILGRKEDKTRFHKVAKEKAQVLLKRAKNKDGSLRLAFDKPETYSLKYNIVWDSIMKMKLFDSVIPHEMKVYFKKMETYGVPLDSRVEYTKTDWQLFVATLCKSKKEFQKFIHPVWKAYHEMDSHAPMSDWYDCMSGDMIEFKNRSVIGGIYLKLVAEKKTLTKGKK